MTETFVPPWQDMNTLCRNICVSPATVDNWVRDGILPPPRKRGRKLMWKWVEVDQYLSDGNGGQSPDAEAERIRNGTKREVEGRAGH
jgi:predicted DNA-binding transcriptional regulator AlpA